MKRRNKPHCVRITGGEADWLLSVDDVARATFHVRGHALDAALRLAEELRTEGSVRVLVDVPSRPPCDRLAS